MNWLRYVLVLSLGVAGVFASPHASAETTCTASMSELRFDEANATTATIYYRCETPYALLSNETIVHMCFAIGAGSTSGSTVPQRLMNIGSDTLGFSISKPPAPGTVNWGNALPAYYETVIDYPLSGGFIASGSEEGQITVYGRIPSRSGLAAGVYSNDFNDTSLTYRYRDGILSGGNPSSCRNGGQAGFGGTFHFTAYATVPGSCTVLTATDMDFSPGGALYATSTGNLAKTSTITLDCTNRTAWQVGLNDGFNDLAADGSRQLCNDDGTCIRYQLNRPPSYGGGRWGNTEDVDTVAGSSTGVPQALTVYGVINDQPLTQAGRYSDTITVTLTY